MKIAVTGTTGFVGSQLTEELLARGHEVVGMDRDLGPNLEQASKDPGFEFRQGDIRDPSYTSVVLDEEIDTIYHLAAVVGVQNYLHSPFDVVDINVIGTRNVLKAAAEHGAKVILASTSEIYGKNPKVPWAEDDDRVLGGTQVDRWSYSTSKAAAEHLAIAASRQLGFPLSIVRYFNAYGPRQSPTYVVSQTVHRALNGLAPILYDSGEQTRCFTFIGDIVDGTIMVGESEKAEGEVFNLGNSTETTVRQVIEMIIEQVGVDVGWEPLATDEEFGAKYQDIDRRIPDVSKALDVLGWKAETTLSEGLQKTIDWARAHPDWLS